MRRGSSSGTLRGRKGNFSFRSLKWAGVNASTPSEGEYRQCRSDGMGHSIIVPRIRLIIILAHKATSIVNRRNTKERIEYTLTERDKWVGVLTILSAG